MSKEFLWWVVHRLDRALKVFLCLFDGFLWFRMVVTFAPSFILMFSSENI